MRNFLDPRKLDLLPTVQQRCRVALQLSGYPEPVEIRKQPANRGAHLLTGEVGAQTEVDAVSECQVLARGPVDQEAVGVIEAARIAVGIVKLFENACGSVDVSGLYGGT